MLIEWFCTFLYKMIVYTVIMTHFFTCCEATVNVNCTAVCIYQNLLWNLNRYDLLCVEGISRGIQVFLGKWVLLTVFKTEAVGLALETGFCLRVSVFFNGTLHLFRWEMFSQKSPRIQHPSQISLLLFLWRKSKKETWNQVWPRIMSINNIMNVGHHWNKIFIQVFWAKRHDLFCITCKYFVWPVWLNFAHLSMIQKMFSPVQGGFQSVLSKVV